MSSPAIKLLQRPQDSSPDDAPDAAAALGKFDIDAFLTEFTEALNTTLDLDTLLRSVSEMVQRIIPYEIFAILLLNERTQELRMRYQIGHSKEVEHLRIKVGQGITGECAKLGHPILINDVTAEPNYINAHPSVRSELAVPLMTRNRVIGVIDIQSAKSGYFQPEHSRLLMLVASRIAAAAENARLYTRVAKQARTLEVLNKISRELTSILNLDQLLRRIGEVLNRLIDFQMFSILLLEEPGGILRHRFSLRFKESVQLKHDIPLGRGLVGAAASTRQAVLAPDVTIEPRYIALNPETGSEVCVPLVHKDQLIGVLDIEHTRRGYFTEDHVRTLSTLAAQIAIAIENARLYERIARQEQRLEQDLAMAREVQMHLLPHCCPTLASAEIAARFEPAYFIGGDIYDFLPYSGSRIAIAVGDVSGKGAPAALYAAMVGGILRSIASSEPDPAEMLQAINLALRERQIDSHFVSMVLALWDDTQHIMRISNSGQPRPVHCRNGKAQIVEATGLPLGLFDEAGYDEVTIQAQPDDVFVLFSDGILDAMNARDERFDRERLEKIVEQHSTHSAETIATEILRSVAVHTAGTPAFDDETVVVVRIKGDAGSKARAETARRGRRTTPALRNI